MIFFPSSSSINIFFFSSRAQINLIAPVCQICYDSNHDVWSRIYYNIIQGGVITISTSDIFETISFTEIFAEIKLHSTQGAIIVFFVGGSASDIWRSPPFVSINRSIRHDVSVWRASLYASYLWRMPTKFCKGEKLECWTISTSVFSAFA